MELDFTVLGRGSWLPDRGQLTAFLKPDNWNDFSFVTLFHLTVFDESGAKHDLGGVKIGFIGQTKSDPTELPDNFKKLESNFFSLGQDVEYYLKIREFNKALRSELLKGLNDVVYSKKYLKLAEKEDVFNISLLRSISMSSIKGQFKRVLDGRIPLTEYRFNYDLIENPKTAGISLEFEVIPYINPPSNIHVLIGRNGVGKTCVLNSMVHTLVGEKYSNERLGIFYEPSRFNFLRTSSKNIFAGVLSIAFSAFDPFDPLPEQEDKSTGIRYSYVGLKRSKTHENERSVLKNRQDIADEFVESLLSCLRLNKKEYWLKSIEALESDPNFADISLKEIVETNKDKLDLFFSSLSSGHAIVLLMVTKLVELVEEKTLVLIDEPESHLHPPLLSSLIRCLSELLTNRNGVAIIATHSPVVVQEVPTSCVWKISRTGLKATAERPEIQTFGENVGVLTREVFGLEVSQSGFHRLLKETISDENSYEEIVSEFEEKLGFEAKLILKALLMNQSLEKSGE